MYAYTSTSYIRTRFLHGFLITFGIYHLCTGVCTHSPLRLNGWTLHRNIHSCICGIHAYNVCTQILQHVCCEYTKKNVYFEISNHKGEEEGRKNYIHVHVYTCMRILKKYLYIHLTVVVEIHIIVCTHLLLMKTCSLAFVEMFG